ERRRRPRIPALVLRARAVPRVDPVGRQLQPSRVARHGKPCGVGAGPEVQAAQRARAALASLRVAGAAGRADSDDHQQLHHSEHVREDRHERRDAEGRDPLGRDRDPAGAAELTTPMTRVGVAFSGGLTPPDIVECVQLAETLATVRALVRDGVVSHRGETITIERFDLWFPPLRSAIAIYVAALFPRMLELAGQLADGVLLTWPTPRAIARAVEHVAIGARRAGRAATAVDIASLIPCAVADSVAVAREAMRPAVGLYAGFLPRYNRLLAEAGFEDAVRAIKEAFARGGREAAAKVVPDELIDAVALAGTADTCRERLAAYRGAGLALPIVSPRM